MQKVLDSARSAIDQRRFADADRWLAEARSESASATAVAALQNDLAGARKAESQAKPEAPPPAGLAASAEAVGNNVSRLSASSPSASGNEAPQPALVLQKPLQPQYPQDAALKGVEGWVELSFVVAADGKPTNVHVTNAAPAGVFDKAAVFAMQRARYEPLSKTDPSLSRQASVRVSFRLSR